MTPKICHKPLLYLSLYIAAANADGNGLIGWGKHMYDPTCAFACRGVIAKCTLLCTPTEGGENHGSHHNPVVTPPECFTSDNAFMRTMAICIDTYCPMNGAPALSKIEDYWYSHLGTGSVGNYKYIPTVSYIEALLAGREDESNIDTLNSTVNGTSDSHSNHKLLRARHGGETAGSESEAVVHSVLPIIKAKMPLNVTSFIDPDDWQLQFNGMRNFEINENGHSSYSITIMFTALFVPVVASLLRFIPGLTRSKLWTYLNSILNYPAVWGTSHRTPTMSFLGGGLIPTRGQALYIALLSFLNIIFLVAPYTRIHPQSFFGSVKEQDLSTIGNRAGNLALGNMVAMFVFSARNNVLIYITDWSHGTFLLLHRWLGYWTILHTILHSIMLLEYYKQLGMYADEMARLYWIWGIVGTVAASAILPSSLLIIRQKAYEMFLLTHILLVAFFLIGFYYHIWYCFEYKWGYEIWAFIAIGIWGTDRIWRLARMGFHGWRIARISPVQGSNGEYIRIDIDSVHLRGVAYLCFPTLTWRFWETHPFSVASSFASYQQEVAEAAISAVDSEKLAIEPVTKPSDSTSTSSAASANALPRAAFVVRTRSSITALLASRLSSANELYPPVLIDGPYHTNAPSQLSDCTDLFCIAGGVGITAVLPYLHAFGAPRKARLFWGVRTSCLIDALSKEMADLPASVHIETAVGKRLDVKGILQDELASRIGGGLLGIVVCGPPGLADDVRHQVTELTRRGVSRAAFVFVDEAFSW
ncbi:hypothetical protein ABW19_dt0208634 [Dactylella cylindrospora]|nr:hypothetical protein ABW19_dt0208634 [Dactylella cylindrospora]